MLQKERYVFGYIVKVAQHGVRSCGFRRADDQIKSNLHWPGGNMQQYHNSTMTVTIMIRSTL